VSRRRIVFRCTECASVAPKWSGRCASCGDWNTLVEAQVDASAPAVPLAPSVPPAPITRVRAADGAPVPTGVAEFDRVLGGGIVPGSVTLLGGEPGVGKSTLVLHLLAAVARRGDTVLYVTGEESVAQVRSRAERIGALDDRLLLAASNSLPDVLAHLESSRPALCVVDSVQTLHDPVLPSAPGSVAQVRECAHRLVVAAKSTGVPVLLVGHVTKDGQLSGPQTLAHVVDTVLSLDGDRHHDVRLLRASKHRFGSTDELGLFRSVEGGLVAVPDPSSMFLADRQAGVTGSVVCAAVDGRRPLLVEVQALVVPSSLPQPRRSVQGLDSGRVSLLLAVLQQRAGVALCKHDVYAATVGGARLVEPAADLAVCLAIVSAALDQPFAGDVAVCGEVGLGGELRQVGRLDRRLAEASRIGVGAAVVPESSPPVDAELRVHRVGTLAEALLAFFATD
jgi:DNA repair protein RadA/Sms